MTEAQLKSALVKHARTMFPKYVIFRHEDNYTSGIPDISITGNRKTSWLEVKHATPGFQSKGIQELTMKRLELAGFAAYVVYYEKDDIQRTYLVLPQDIGKQIPEWTKFTPGFNHLWILDYIRKIHVD